MLWTVSNTHGQPGYPLPIINGQMTTDCHRSHANYSGLWLTFFALKSLTAPHFTSPAVAGGNETSQQVSDCEHDILTLISFEKWKKIN